MIRLFSLIFAAAFSIAVAATSQADEKPAADPSKAATPRHADVRALLESGQAIDALPAGVAVRLSANMTRIASATRRHPAGEAKTFKEIWEFTSSDVHRVVDVPTENGNLIQTRAESIPLDSSGICKELLDGKLLTIGQDEKGNREIFIDTDYDIGHRSIEILLNGNSVLWVGESCVAAGYTEKDARAFAALYEKLAKVARDAFDAKRTNDGQGK